MGQTENGVSRRNLRETMAIDGGVGVDFNVKKKSILAFFISLSFKHLVVFFFLGSWAHFETKLSAI